MEECFTSVMSVKNEILNFKSQNPNLQTALAEIAKLQPMFKELLSSCSFKPFFLDYNPSFLGDDVKTDVLPPPNELPQGDLIQDENSSNNAPRDQPRAPQLNIFGCISAAANLVGPVAQIIDAGNRKDLNAIINSLDSVVNALDGLINGCFKK